MSHPNEYQVGGKTHYKEHSIKCPHCKESIDPWDFYGMLPYIIGNIFKYILRHDKKGGKEDLLKAKHYLEKLISVCYPES